jgi:polysaccharide export outer membrane protein
MKLTITAIFAILASVHAAGVAVCAQSADPAPKKNFPYSQNPRTKPSPEALPATGKVELAAARVPEPKSEATSPAETQATRSIAEKTLEVVKNAARRALPPTEYYLVGPGDVLYVALQNNARTSTYFTVLSDGTIDYPLAGEMVQVSGLSAEEIEELLASKIKIYENPNVSVKIREYNSHRISVLGLVENGGERPLQREAVPLFVIRADALVRPNADTVTLRRRDGGVERFDLRDSKWENVLAYPGDEVEFSASTTETAVRTRFVFISGEINNGGRLDYHDGLTLTQAIVMAGGTKRQGARKALIRRKNANGLLDSTEYSLRAINDGKAPDPELSAGDLIEIRN